jgi:hypothetical protein
MEGKLDMLLLEISEFKKKQQELIKKIDSLVSMNNDLITANLKNLCGKTVIDNKSQLSTKTVEELYYGEDNNSFYIYGSTYDVKDKIKSLGGKWDKSNSRWVISECEEDDINKLFPEIIKKQYSNNKCLIDD